MVSSLAPSASSAPRFLGAGAFAWLWLVPAGFPAAAAQGEEGSVLVVDVSPPSERLDVAALRAAIGSELGVVAVSPWDPRAPSSRGTIRVHVDDSGLEVVYEERHVIRRRVSAPVSGEATEKAATLLAGNLARHEASDIASWLGAKTATPWPASDPAADAPALEPPKPSPSTEPAPPRFWVGLSAEADAMSLDGNRYFLHPGIAIATTTEDINPSGVGLNGRILLDADYAISQHALVGVRAGVMLSRYPGTMGSGINLDRYHLEGRGTWILGTLGDAWAPYLCAGFGAANFDVEHDAGDFQIWKSHGPLFGTAGFGFRIALFSTTAAEIAPAKLTLVFPNDTALAWSPELSMKVGF